MNRVAGVLMPISSLPGNQGIGDFGKHTYRLIMLLNKLTSKFGKFYR